MPTQELHDGRWRPAVPLPLFGILHVSCRCGKRFWGICPGSSAGSRSRYEAHYRHTHLPHPFLESQPDSRG